MYPVVDQARETHAAAELCRRHRRHHQHIYSGHLGQTQLSQLPDPVDRPTATPGSHAEIGSGHAD
jgi:hypothetical protein